uniref:Putative secreted protein n=1 Tax=Panstrongylus lignarius TaxID=156445 RepID=A0A224XU76_9HEMI
MRTMNPCMTMMLIHVLMYQLIRTEFPQLVLAMVNLKLLVTIPNYVQFWPNDLLIQRIQLVVFFHVQNRSAQ